MAKSSYRRYCAVYGCLNSITTHPDISFFKLPGKFERRLEWLQLIARNDLEYKRNFAVYRVCEKHFNVEDIRQSTKRKLLKKSALPVLMLPSAQIIARKKEDKQTQTASTGVENCTQTENAANELAQSISTQTDFPKIEVRKDLHGKTDENQRDATSSSVSVLASNTLLDTPIKMEDPTENCDMPPEQFMLACDKYLSSNLSSIVKTQVTLKIHCTE